MIRPIFNKLYNRKLSQLLAQFIKTRIKKNQLNRRPVLDNVVKIQFSKEEKDRL